MLKGEPTTKDCEAVNGTDGRGVFWILTVQGYALDYAHGAHRAGCDGVARFRSNTEADKFLDAHCCEIYIMPALCGCVRTAAQRELF